VQSFVDQEARSVGRLHERDTVLDEIARLREAGLDNINIDLIAGLPHQTAESWAFSVSETIATGVPHASVYMLEVDEDSRLGRELIAGGARYHAHFVPDDDATADFYQQACEMLETSGMPQYEISNFARCKAQSRHNLKYWTRQPYLGFGVDAHSMLSRLVSEGDNCQALRFATPDSLEAYMNGSPHKVTLVSDREAIEESFFLGLRLNSGIELDILRKNFKDCHPDPECVKGEGPALRQNPSSRLRPTVRAEAVAIWESAICGCVQDGLLEQRGAILRLTARGRLLSNEVFARFLIEEKEETRVGTIHANPR
jgi:oxygen-independent coproporphyrinogen-3 oxidase